MAQKNKKKIIPVVILVAVVIVFLFLTLFKKDNNVFLVSGTVEAREVDISPRLAGRIEAIYADEGDHIKKGSLLLQMDDQQLKIQVERAISAQKAANETLRDLEAGARKEEVASAVASLEAAEATYKKSFDDLKRAEELFKEGAASKDFLERASLQLDTTKTNRDMAKEKLDLLKAGARINVVESAKYAVQQAQHSVDELMFIKTDSRTFSPIDGIITLRSAEPGEVIAPGTPVLTVINPADCYVRIYISEKVLGQVSIGQEIEVFTDSFPDKAFKGKLTYISSEAEFTPRNIQTQDERVKLVYAAKVTIKNDDLMFKPGMPVDVKIRLKSDPGK
jgi:HlyD family secretion protein